MNTTIKTPKNLYWTALASDYPVATVKVNGVMTHVDALKDAIEDGTLLTVVTETAAANGLELDDMMARLMRNWSSNKSYANNRYDCPSKTRDLRRIDMLMEFGRQLRADIKKKSGKKSRWETTAEEILAIPLENIDLLEKIKENMASKLSKDPEHIPDMAEFEKNYAAARKRYSEAYARSQAAPAVTLDDSTMSLVSKLKDGKSLSKSDKAALAALLEKLSK